MTTSFWSAPISNSVILSSPKETDLKHRNDLIRASNLENLFFVKSVKNLIHLIRKFVFLTSKKRLLIILTSRQYVWPISDVHLPAHYKWPFGRGSEIMDKFATRRWKWIMIRDYGQRSDVTITFVSVGLIWVSIFIIVLAFLSLHYTIHFDLSRLSV